MPAHRRRVLRPVPAELPAESRPTRLPTWRARLEKERQAFNRWMSRLKRAMRTVEKHQRCITRLERRIAQAE